MKKICIFLSMPYRGGSLEGAKNIAKMLSLASKAAKSELKIFFSCCANTYNIDEEFFELKALGIEVVETVWKDITRKEVEYALNWRGSQKPLRHSKYWIPSNSSNNFSDCDLWLFISDRCHFPIAPIVPYGMVIYDYIQRYMPDIFTDKETFDICFMQSARDSDFVICTTPQTLEDANQYAGIHKYKLYLAPMEFNPKIVNHNDYDMYNFDYFLWTTNTTQHKNHTVALSALKKYYTELGGKFKVIITGAMTSYLKDGAPYLADYTEQVKKMIYSDNILKNNITIAGELNNPEYVSVLEKAKFLFHPAIYDNGTYSVIEAAYYGVPSLSSNYGQMKYINDRFKLNMNMFSSSDPQKMAEAIKTMELTHSENAEKLPSKDYLSSFTYDRLANDYWKIIKEYL